MASDLADKLARRLAEIRAAFWERVCSKYVPYLESNMLVLEQYQELPPGYIIQERLMPTSGEPRIPIAEFSVYLEGLEYKAKQIEFRTYVPRVG